MRKIKAFTLIELSIVTVIIGLIVAGVVSGQSLVRQSQLRAVIAESNEITSAVNTFRVSYNYYPGDIPNAYSYFGTALSCTDSNVNLVAGGCNGDGNGKIDGNYPTEGIRAWQHLQQADLYSGDFTNATINTSGYFIYNIGADVPSAAINNGGWEFAFGPTQHLRLGGQADGGTVSINRYVLTPTEAYSIDAKIDDGLAVLGSIRGFDSHDGSSWLTTCLNGGTDYHLSQTSIACRVFFYTF